MFLSQLKIRDIKKRENANYTKPCLTKLDITLDTLDMLDG